MLREKTEHLAGGSDDGPGVTSLIHLKLSLTHLDFFTNSHRRRSSTLWQWQAGWCFSNFNTHMNHIGIQFTSRFWFSKSRGPCDSAFLTSELVLSLLVEGPHFEQQVGRTWWITLWMAAQPTQPGSDSDTCAPLQREWKQDLLEMKTREGSGDFITSILLRVSCQKRQINQPKEHTSLSKSAKQ